MHKPTRWIACVAVAGVMVAACRHPAPSPTVTPSEAQPLGQRPDIAKPPLGAPGTGATPAQHCEKPPCSEPRAIHPTSMLKRLGADPAAANVPRLPDAGVDLDGGVPLPPPPDASPTVLHDAGTPMR
ncbi:MAG: hypothetical protein JWO36_6406 [Myxococcales bacterium]|nr:hypothetical protein [Myxococcales bacterium]